MERFLPHLRMPLAGLWATLLFTSLTFTALAQRPFITTWKTDNPGESITVPVNDEVSGYNYTVDWGDGNTSTSLIGDASHTYAVAGTYTVTINGDFPAIKLGEFGIEVSNKLVSIEQWGDIAWASMEGAFSGARYMVLNAADVPDLSGVSSLERMFSGAELVNGNLSSWDVSGVTDMSGMFNGAAAFNGDITGWNVHNVTDMSWMFWGASVFNQDIGGWEVGNVEDMSFMFYQAPVFNQDLGSWDVSRVTTMNSMFFIALNFDQSLGSWDISNVTDMDDMLLSTGFSSANYGATLIGWATLPTVPSDITLDASGQEYCPGTAAETARQELEMKGWHIIGDSPATDCGGGGTNSSPAVTGLPSVVTVEEDATTDALNISAATIEDVDAGSGALTLTLQATGGIFDIASSPGITITGHLTDRLALTGNLTDLNNYINVPTNIFFRPAANLNGVAAAQVDVFINDNGHTGSEGGIDISVGTIQVDITAVNDAPEVSLPATIGVIENVASALVGISFTDVDAGSGNINVRLDVPAGRLIAAPVSGIAAAGNGTNGLTISGSLANINSLFSTSNVTYENEPGNRDDQLLEVTINDSGNTGSGGNLSDDGTVLIRITPSVPADPSNFITIWKTDNDGPSGGDQIRIPADGEFTYAWVDINNPASTGSGSGNDETTITFPQAGTYEVRIAPTGSTPFNDIFFGESVSGDKLKLLEIKNWGAIHWSKFEFGGCTNLTVSATDIPDLTGVTDLSFAFSYSGIDDIPNINDWDVSNVTDLSCFLQGVTGFNQSLSNWDVSNVTNMSFMFDGATSFNQPLDSWDVRKLENFQSMFREASSFDQSLGAWELESLMGAIAAFYNSGMSCENYSYTLYGWATNPNTNSNVQFYPGGGEYSPAVVPYRDFLIGNLEWGFGGDALGTCSITLPSPPITPDDDNILYVDINVNTAGSGYTGAGDSWENAIPELADALKWAREQHDGGSPGWDDTDPLRIFVAVGTYRPLYNAADDAYTTDGGRDNSFVLLPDVQLYGGFDPASGIETLEDARILPNHQENTTAATVLNGDLAGDDAADIPVADLVGHPTRQDNAYSVVRADGAMGGALLNGFVITGGNNNPNNNGNGGGIALHESSPTLSNLTVSSNSASNAGGGVASMSGSSPKISHIVFSGNSAKQGGGMAIEQGSPMVHNSIFVENEVEQVGGGIGVWSASPVLSNVTISDNSSGIEGGGMAIFESSATIMNSIVWGNNAGVPDFVGIYVFVQHGSLPTFSNSLIENSGGSENWGDEFYQGIDGGNNIDVDPEFANTTPDDANFLQLQQLSPAINRGSNQGYTDAGGDLANDLDLAGNPRVYAGIPDPDRIDMGAYEFQGDLNIPPVAVDDETGVTENIPATGNVLTNDSDPDGDAIIASLVTAPVNGTVVLNADGSFTYTPNSSYYGRDSLIYQACDNGTPSLCDTATLRFEIIPVNDAPIAVDDAFTTDAGMPVIGNVLTNDSDPEGDALTASLVTASLNGTVLLNPDGGFTYTPDDNFIGLDSLIYQVCDNGTPSLCDTAMVRFTVDPTSPKITKVSVQDPDGTYKMGDQISIDVTFDQPVVASDAGDLPSLELETGITDQPAILYSGNNRVITFMYTVQAGDETEDLDYTSVDALKLNGSNIRGVNGGKDADLTLPVPDGANSISGQHDIVIDGVIPEVTSVEVPAANYYKTGNNLDFTVHFSENVAVNISDSAPYLPITVGEKVVEASYLAGSGLDALTFRYTVQEDDLDLDGIVVGDELFSAGATLQDLAGNEASRKLNEIGDTRNVYVYSVRPSVTLSAEESSPLNGPFTLTAIFSEAVTGFTVADITVSNATLSDLQTADNITYTVLVTPSSGGNIGLAVPENVAVNIADNGNNASNTLTIRYKETLSGITFRDSSFVYDGTAKSLVIAGTLPVGASVGYQNNSRTDVGMQTVTAYIDGGENYTSDTLVAALAVTPLDIAVTATDKTKVFGSDDPELTYTVGPQLIGDDTFTGSLGREPGEAVGSYAITQGDLTAGDNYEITFAEGMLTITRAGYQGIEFNDLTTTYDGAEHRLILTGELPVGGSVHYENNRRRDAGSQEATATISGDNYETLLLTATLAVKPLAITVTAEDKEKPHGSADPELTYTVKPALIDGDTFTGTLSREPGEESGTYAIEQGTLSAGSNYEITFIGSGLTITRPLPTEITGVVFVGRSYVYNGEEHTLFLTGDLPEGTTVNYANNGRTDAGSQQVTATIEGEGYETLVLTATLTVTPAERTITFPELQEKTYGDDDFDGNAIASSGEEIAYTTSNEAVAAIVAGRIRIIGAGETTITATVAENGNYTGRPTVSRRLVVRKAPQTIRLDVPEEVGRDAGSIPLPASATSGLPISLAIDDEQVATLDGQTLNILRLGTVTLTATQPGDANHEAADPVVVTIRVLDPSADLPIRVHPVVSPNGDGINEFLMVEAIRDYPENRMTIFNRNGTVLWEASGYDNNRVAFRGTGTGQLRLPAGTYFYIVEVKVDGAWKNKKGWFVLGY